MKTPNVEKSEQKACLIVVSLPVDTDEDALAVKKKIDAAVSEIDGCRVDFRLTNVVSTDANSSKPI
ncbi:hypothetical protein LCGC14_1176840 [marine sediment metagenome]|uniref:Uncharacterized protein n=1 Tax=marine sediment metagenome TaxID=412755 RepID=A0A0F9LNB9_9ZZZZ